MTNLVDNVISMSYTAVNVCNERILMIKRLGFSNFYSFKEYSEVSFEFDKNVPESISKGLSTGTVIGIKGSNGSGKTNVIKAINFFFAFCLDKFSYYGVEKKTRDSLPYKSFFDSDDVTEFDIEFLIDDITYIYELEIKKNKIIKETIIRNKKRDVVLIERNEHGTIECIKDFDELKNIKLRDDQSIISIVDKFKFNNKMYELDILNLEFVKLLSNVDYNGYYDFSLGVEGTTKRYKESEELFEFIKGIIKSADSGIKDIVIKDRLNEDGEKVYFPLFVHENEGKEFFMPFKDESSGTKELYKKMIVYHFVLNSGGVLAFDEFDVHLHANVLPMIVNLFLDFNINKKHAQFIFTAHNTEIIDTLGRYRSVLVNKEDNESYCYRLDEIKGSILRNGRPISPVYKEGKIGGVPPIFLGGKEL